MRSDAELIRAARENPDLFRLLYDRYADRLHRFFSKRTRDPQAALDLTAETFAQAWLSKERFRDVAAGSAAPWLFTIARRLLIASVERGRLEQKAVDQLRVELGSAGAVAPQPHEDWLDGLDADLETALGELPAQQRRAVELRVLDGLPYGAIGRRVGCSSTAARIRVSRGLKRLRARMETN
jgi:RNA polymerase sigma-70 factor (ECF subfamily)